MERIRAEAPLVHNITNFVVMNTTANALLAVGASPVRADADAGNSANHCSGQRLGDHGPGRRRAEHQKGG
jgi:hypothetical protein